MDDVRAYLKQGLRERSGFEEAVSRLIEIGGRAGCPFQ